VRPVASVGAVRRRIRWLILAAVVGLAILCAPSAWLWAGSAGHIGDQRHAPHTGVAIVFGAQLAPGGTAPMPFLRGRLDTTVALVRAGTVTAVLVSGDAHGSSGNEVAVMRGYLIDHGVPARRIVTDGDGLDSYDTCRRAHDVYGIRRALLVSQSFHLHRAVTLCGGLGIDAQGVAARCDGCAQVTLLYNRVREVGAAWKAGYDRLSDRPPAVSSPPDPAVSVAIRG
jgi:vancomycin permeability regulator SanA